MWINGRLWAPLREVGVLLWKKIDGDETGFRSDGSLGGRTWKFGPIWQCHAVVGNVTFCLQPRKTKKAAKRHIEEWVSGFTGPFHPEVVYQESYDNWPTISWCRTQVISHIWCTTGNGYQWLDGGIVCTDPEDHLGRGKRDEAEERKWRETVDFLTMENGRVVNWELRRDLLPPKESTGRPQPDPEQRIRFYPVSEGYALITKVPGDIRPEWYLAALEAAWWLFAWSTEESNARAGLKALERLLTMKLGVLATPVLLTLRIWLRVTTWGEVYD